MKIAIDHGLLDVKSFLLSQGYDIEDFEVNQNNLNNFDAVIVSGQSINIMGMEETSTPIPIINATGLTPQEIYYKIQTIQH